LSLVIPGAGQIYKGKLTHGVVWLLIVGGLYILGISTGKPPVIGVIFHLLCIWDAYRGNEKTEGKYSIMRGTGENEASKGQAE
jgi:hypothetical protein